MAKVNDKDATPLLIDFIIITTRPFTFPFFHRSFPPFALFFFIFLPPLGFILDTRASVPQRDRPTSVSMNINEILFWKVSVARGKESVWFVLPGIIDSL